ncbi:unnamed protein product [Closterium sp. NIES-53]
MVLELVTGGTLRQLMIRGDLDALTWQERVQVAVDVASALYHLHYNHTPPFVHRAVTSSNVLLTEDMTAKVLLACCFGGDLDALTWQERVQVAVDVASALYHLHYNHTPPFVHRAVTSSNVLLTEDMTAKSSLGVATTADVLAYGVLLLELITGQTADGTTQIVATPRYKQRSNSFFRHSPSSSPFPPSSPAAPYLPLQSAPFLDDPQMMPLMADAQLGGHTCR